MTSAANPPPRRHGRDDRDAWPPDDGGTGQVLGCVFALPGAIIGTVAGLVIGFVTDDPDLKATHDYWILVATPILAWGLGLFVATIWDGAVVRVTRTGRRLERFRSPGQTTTAILAAVVPAFVAIWFLLVWPMWILPATIALGVLAYGPSLMRSIGDVVR